MQEKSNTTSHVYIIEQQPNPSTDYYILPALAHANLEVIKFNFEQTPSHKDLLDATIIFVRYVPENWAKLISKHSASIKKIIFFMDDDLLDFNASSNMVWHYRYKILKLSVLKARWLRTHNAEVWVSTPFLLNKYADWYPKLIQPFSFQPINDSCRVFYHGSFTHRAEVNWLRPIIEEVLKKNARIAFDIVGDKEVFKLYKGLPRVTTIHPMKWPAYKQFTNDCKGSIGLAPLLDNVFNKARSHVKFLDFTRNDAVGIYSEGSEYAKVVAHGQHGIILPLKADQWVSSILSLANDSEKRQWMLKNAKERIKELDHTALQSYQALNL